MLAEVCFNGGKPNKLYRVQVNVMLKALKDQLNQINRRLNCWNKMCLTLPLESFDDNKVLKIVNWIC